MDRREFFRLLGRIGAGAGLAALVARLALCRRGSGAAAAPCAGCGLRTLCPGAPPESPVEGSPHHA